MQKTMIPAKLRWVALTVPLFALPACGGGGGTDGNSPKPQQSASAAGCPTAAEVQAAVERFENKNQITEYNKDIWHVQALRNFRFSPMQFGDVTREQVKWGTEAQEACPVRLTYTYEQVNTDGAVKPRDFGRGLTFYFFKNAFHEWDYRYGS